AQAVERAPVDLSAIPASRLRSDVERLPEAARERALQWLSDANWSPADAAYLRADRQGGIFYEDPTRENGATAEAAGEPSIQGLPAEQVFTLHSRPGASRVVYLDMDGAVVTNSWWYSGTLTMRPYSIDSDFSTFTQAELDAIAETWKRVAEDFAPYDIDVTTEEPAAFGPNVGHILVTRKASVEGPEIYSCNCGGVAYLSVWGQSYFPTAQPALVFTDGVGTGPHNISEAASHELGHNLGLSHDNTSTQGYYGGHGSGNTKWGPIMGVGYYAQVSQWSIGEYADAQQFQDDLAIIAGKLRYRPDDHVDTDFAQATALQVVNETVVFSTNPVSDPGNADPANKGVIEDRTDIDLFSFSSGAGTVDLTVTPAWIQSYYNQGNRGMNLDVQAKLYTAGGTLIAQSNPTNDTFAQVTTTVDGGDYVLAIEGVGVGDPLTNGYTDYGSIGQYFINGSIPTATVVTLPPPAPTGLQGAVVNENSISLDWVDPASTADNTEAGYRVWRAIGSGDFSLLASLPRNSTAYADNNLANGDYRYVVEAWNAIGNSPSDSVGPFTINVPFSANVTSELTTFGSVISGSYLNTRTASGTEVLAEASSGGKPSSRTSRLEHTWSIASVQPGAVVTLEVDAQAGANSENDNFAFSYAIGAGPWINLGTLLNGTARQVLSTQLPSSTSGLVQVRVVDTDRTSGRGNIDQLSVYRIRVVSAGDPGEQAPVVTITSPAAGATVSFGNSVQFTATASDYEDGNLGSALSWSSSLDGDLGTGASLATSRLSLGTHVVTASVTDSASNTSTDTVTITVIDGSAATLTIRADKVKGVNSPTLTWSNLSGSTVNVFRNGSLLTGTANDNSYQDRAGKGGATYVYQVCETGSGGKCTPEVSVTY
ncbi:MAG: M66 family metalloprotease, partial [Steroidobacteraceae bacterium]